MVIPDKIIEALELLSFSDRAQTYAAVISFMRNGTEPEEGEISDTAMGMFILARQILIPILRRRRRDAARRAARRLGTPEEIETEHIPALELDSTPGALNAKSNSADEAESSVDGRDGIILNRAARRRMERLERKKLRRAAV